MSPTRPTCCGYSASTEIARQVQGLEASLTPTQRVVAWLDEIHSFGDLESYTRALLDQPPEAQPIDRLAGSAARAARAALRGRPAEVVEPAVRKALRATVFRFELVLQANVKAHERLDRESLVYA